MWNTSNEKNKNALRRLIRFTDCEYQILKFLKENDIVTESDIEKVFIRNDDIEDFILKSVKNNPNVTLYSLNWTILPKECIDFSIATKRDFREFSYDE